MQDKGAEAFDQLRDSMESEAWWQHLPAGRKLRTLAERREKPRATTIIQTGLGR